MIVSLSSLESTNTVRRCILYEC